MSVENIQLSIVRMHGCSHYSAILIAKCGNGPGLPPARLKKGIRQ